MGRRSEKGMIDPFLHRKVPRRRGIQPGIATPRGNRHNGETEKDARQVNQELSAIHKDAMEKEFAIAAAVGPHSTPEQNYPKSFRIKK